MEVVLEVVNRAGRLLERQRASGARLTIGRAFDNDLILSDETVSPHHAALEIGSQGEVVLIDLDSLNGVRTERHERINGSIALRSGEEYSFGRARVRVYDTAHGVADTVRIGGVDWLINRLGSTPSVFAILCLAMVVATTEQWLNSYSEILWQELAVGLFSVMVVGISIAALWAIVGRVVKHEGRFQAQLAFVMLYLLLQSAVVYAYELLLFNSLNTPVATSFSFGVSFLLLVALLWINLHIATNLNSGQRWKFAGTISVVLLCVSIFPELLEQTEFSDMPDYVKEIETPALRAVDGHDLDWFIGESAALFDATVHDET